MRRAAWIFFASILLPSLVLAWLAVRSVRDQQVVLEHQQAIICQNITDTLATNIQVQMDGVRADFVKTTQDLLSDKSPQILAQNFNRTLREAWPAAEIGFAVNLNGEIYSPTPYDGPEARTFRDENDRFLSNRENVEVYASNSSLVTQNGALMQNNLARNAVLQNAAGQFALKLPEQVNPDAADKKEAPDELKKQANAEVVADVTKDLQHEVRQKKGRNQETGEARGAAMPANEEKTVNLTPPADSESYRAETDASATKAVPAPAALPRPAPAATVPALDDAPTVKATITSAPQAQAALPTAAAAPAAPAAANAPATTGSATESSASPATPPMPSGGEAQTISVPAATVVTAPPPPGHPADLPISPTLSLTSKAEQDAQRKPRPVIDVTSGTPGAQPTPDSSGGLAGADAAQSLAPQQFFSKIARNVVPQQVLTRDTAPLSNTVPEESDFRRVIGSETSGELARFLEDKMRLLVWLHPSADAPIVFGAQLDRDKLMERLQSSLKIKELAQSSFDSFSRTRSGDSNFCAAILDDTGHPVATSRAGFTADWKHPFVATEIGEALPHWEAALYLVDPQQFSRTARTLQCAFFVIVIFLIAAIVAGGSFIGRDVRREMLLAQQKTDFVSNVSHELKTPLTSIRMFADLLAEKRVPDADRQATYLRIIAAEASRLTRLINNVLDFARLEKGAPHGEHAACDLVEAARDVADTCGPHLEAAGVSFQCEIEAETLPIRGDRDALAQIILNLISNAEKYGGNDVLVRVRRQEIATGALGCVDVLDRGAGIPARQVKEIFEPFRRLDDSLSSGIPGTGLGLTLARKMARVHGGDVTYSARAGGGSCFTLAVPLV